MSRKPVTLADALRELYAKRVKEGVTAQESRRIIMAKLAHVGLRYHRELVDHELSTHDDPFAVFPPERALDVVDDITTARADCAMTDQTERRYTDELKIVIASRQHPPHYSARGPLKGAKISAAPFVHAITASGGVDFELPRELASELAGMLESASIYIVPTQCGTEIHIDDNDFFVRQMATVLGRSRAAADILARVAVAEMQRCTGDSGLDPSVAEAAYSRVCIRQSCKAMRVPGPPPVRRALVVHTGPMKPDAMKVCYDVAITMRGLLDNCPITYTGESPHFIIWRVDHTKGFDIHTAAVKRHGKVEVPRGEAWARSLAKCLAEESDTTRLQLKSPGVVQCVDDDKQRNVLLILYWGSKSKAPGMLRDMIRFLRAAGAENPRLVAVVDESHHPGQVFVSHPIKR